MSTAPWERYFSCMKKRRHPTFFLASVALTNTLRKSNKTVLHVYSCDHCGGFHIGKLPKKRRKA